MNSIEFKKSDILDRVYFIIKLVQNQNGSTMQGALTSKSDSMGGIFDRFINTISDSLIFDKIILPKVKTNKKVDIINDYYYYKPSKNNAGIAPDIFGLIIDGKQVPFTQFDNKWKPVKGMPQIEVKTYKAKDQMISLRNQDYDDEYLVLVDLDLRIDYLVPFMDNSLLNEKLINNMQMDDNVFIKRDDKNQITRISKIDYSNDVIGNIKLLSITNGTDFMKQTTFCDSNVSVRRMKEITERQLKIRNGLLHEKLSIYAEKSPRIDALYCFNKKWKEKNKITGKVELLDFSAKNINDIEICKYNSSGIVITALTDGCAFNETELEKGKQYTVTFDTLDRSGNGGTEFFMQKQCAIYLKGLEKELIGKFEKVINSVD